MMEHKKKGTFVVDDISEPELTLEPIFSHLVMGGNELVLVGFSVVAESMLMDISIYRLGNRYSER